MVLDTTTTDEEMPPDLGLLIILTPAGCCVGVSDGAEARVSKLLKWHRALATLPPAIVVTAFDAGTVGTPPSVQFIVDGDVDVCTYRTYTGSNPRGDVEYTVRIGRLDDEPHGDGLTRRRTYATVRYDDPRGIIGGMVDEIGKAALRLATNLRKQQRPRAGP